MTPDFGRVGGLDGGCRWGLEDEGLCLQSGL